MKSITKKMLLMLMLLFFVSVNANAAADVPSVGGELDLFTTTAGMVTTGDEQSPIGLSPKVVARYKTSGTDATDTQWFAIGTLHPGGNKVFGTAQDVNNVYSQDHSTGTAVATSLDKIPALGQSSSVWSNAGWDL